MTCVASQHFLTDSADEVSVEVRMESQFTAQEYVTFCHGGSRVTISGAPGITQALIEKLAIEVAASNAVRNADHAERAMLKDEEVHA